MAALKAVLHDTLLRWGSLSTLPVLACHVIYSICIYAELLRPSAVSTLCNVLKYNVLTRSTSEDDTDQLDCTGLPHIPISPRNQSQI